MKALSIKQPWAYLIAAGFKDIENRSWKTNYRGKFLIHASKNICDMWKNKTNKLLLEYHNLIDNYFLTDSSQNTDNYSSIFSAIIGECEITDCIQDSKSIWAESGCWHFVLKNPVLYDKPIINVKGALNFWNYER